MTDTTLWWIALALGLVVIVVAVALLETFLRQVHRIERGSLAIWEAGKQVAANTATTWQLGATSARLDELTTEALRHDALLRSGAAGRDGQGS
jgi:flagellar basal body-associated protein FliL